MALADKRIKAAVEIALAAVVITICSWITIPIPSVPFTLQIFGVYAAIFMLGGLKGTLAVALHIALGLIGVPVFSGFKPGLPALLGPTGGYIWGFLLAALFMWLIQSVVIKNPTAPKTLAAAFGALLLCYAFGTAWFVYVYTRDTGSVGVRSALTLCVLPYIVPDVLKILGAYKLAQIVKKRVEL
ncbi:MAG: biotin transporter BioY [Clostridia bacterium]|nr:biotin transporter BioY [Clostridia bacterium]